MSDELVKLGDIAHVVPGFAFKSTDLGSTGIAVIRIGDIPNRGEVDGGGALRVPADLIAERHSKFALSTGDIVMSMTGEGKVGRVVAAEPLMANQRVAKISAKNSTDQQFLWYALASSGFDDAFRQVAAGAAQQNISGGQLEALKVAWPRNASVRRRAADALSAYDSLIANNRRRMALLEQAARLLYDEWFVRLRFPGHEGVRVVDGVPEGWAKAVLGDICEDLRDTVDPAELDPDTPYIGLEHMPRRSIALADWGRADEVTSTKLRYLEGDVLFGKIRPYFHKVGIAFTDGVTSSDAIVLRANEVGFAALLLMTVSSDAFVAVTAQGMKEGSKMPRADVKQMLAYPVLLPSDRVLREFDKVVGGMTQQLRILSFQARKLEQARDLLLPRLMSGEVVS